MGKGRKKRSAKRGKRGSLAASDEKKVGAGGSLELGSCADFSSECKTGAASNGESSSSFSLPTKLSSNGESSSSFSLPTKLSSVPCRYFQRGDCWNGLSCRFLHSEGPITATPKPTPLDHQPGNAPAKEERSPKECIDWYLTGSCPRLRTCRYAHPPVVDMKHGTQPLHKMGLSGFENMLEMMIRAGLDESSGDDSDGDMEQRMRRNGGFTDDDLYELSLQGIKPWDPEAWDALAALKGYDMFDYGYDSDDFTGYGL